jgi:hypothetical protein
MLRAFAVTRRPIVINLQFGIVRPSQVVRLPTSIPRNRRRRGLGHARVIVKESDRIVWDDDRGAINIVPKLPFGDRPSADGDLSRIDKPNPFVAYWRGKFTHRFPNQSGNAAQRRKTRRANWRAFDASSKAAPPQPRGHIRNVTSQFLGKSFIFNSAPAKKAK